ncbi:unnamed protein product [Lepeophtheirus salmonis]|uniref:(salmon louse) hypothetical protein n=1 Tax=Lepeophtheirus salmonis TaxID=72036 RepID=A0A7R8H3T8_LEPSM|nr:unnamed protein product [Lepeophtheirus salmonis]CAF2839055.1 unnamed protein product [Lepeophtheirus salmonis]
MPARKKPRTLQDLSLRSIGGIIKEASYLICDQKDEPSYRQFKAKLIRDLQVHLFQDTVHIFHKLITKEILIALSEIQYQYENGGESDMHIQRNCYNLTKEQLDLIEVLRHPLVREINISKEFLGPRWKLHWKVVCKLSSRFIDMDNLEILNLGNWNSVGKYCPNLILLKVHSSDIGDRVLSWLSKCRKLQYVELYENQNVSPVGYAQMLRSNPQLKSLGRCECFGSVLTTIFDDNSIYRKSVVNVPEFLNLVEIDSSERIATKELMFLIQNCPKVKKLRIKYYPDDYRFDEKESSYLSALIGLDQLTDIRLIGANFYSHLFFQFIYIQGWQLLRMELTSVDELNINAIKTMGEHCLNLEVLSFTCCHFQLSNGDKKTIDDLTRPEKIYVPERYFKKLQNLSFLLLSPLHLCIAKYCLAHALELKKLIFDQYRNDIEEQLLQSIFEWNPLLHLEHFEIGSGAGKLSVHAANLVIQNCTNLKYIGKLARWGKITHDQIVGIKSEAQIRNYDLVIDHDDTI